MGRSKYRGQEGLKRDEVRISANLMKGDVKEWVANTELVMPVRAQAVRWRRFEEQRQEIPKLGGTFDIHVTHGMIT